MLSFNTQPPEGGWAFCCFINHDLLPSFNTQPPEGGWVSVSRCCCTNRVFQHTAARRRLVKVLAGLRGSSLFQHTAARRRLVCCQYWICRSIHVSTHSRPKAAGEAVDKYEQWLDVSTHSRPKAAGSIAFGRGANTSVSTHSRPKAAGNPCKHDIRCNNVSTHSRPKAAG